MNGNVKSVDGWKYETGGSVLEPGRVRGSCYSMPIVVVNSDGQLEPGHVRSRCYSMPVLNSRLVIEQISILIIT